MAFVFICPNFRIFFPRTLSLVMLLTYILFKTSLIAAFHLQGGAELVVVPHGGTGSI